MTQDAPRAKHTAVRPSWTCADHARPVGWPCHAKRASLLVEFADDRTALPLFMIAFYVDASRELSDVPGSIVYGRFIGWTR